MEEQRDLFEIDNIGTVCGIALRQHRGTGNHLAAGFLHQLFNGLQTASGRNHIIDHRNLFPFDKCGIMLIDYQNLFLAHIGNGVDGSNDRIAHIALYRLTGNNIAGHLHHLRHLIDQRNALCLGSHQHLGLGGELGSQRTGTRLYHLGIAKNNKARNGHIFIDRDNGKTAFYTCNGNVIEFLHGNPPFLR